MTDLHQKYPCVKCGKKLRHLHGPEKNLCLNCSKKTRIPVGPIIFNEPLDHSVQLSTILTLTQYQTLIKRLKFLFPNKNKNFKLTGITKYLRELILNDLKKWEKLQ